MKTLPYILAPLAGVVIVGILVLTCIKTKKVCQAESSSQWIEPICALRGKQCPGALNFSAALMRTVNS